MDVTLVLLSFLNFVASPFAVVGNSLVIHALWRCRSLHPPSKLLLGCLATTDLLLGLYAQPQLAVNIAKSGSSLDFYIHVNAELDFFPISTITLGYASLITVTAIALDRFLALHLRQRYRTVVTLRRLMVLLVCFYLVAPFCEVYWRVSRFEDVGFSILLLAVATLCILVSTVAFARVCWKLRHHQSQVQGHIEHNNSNGNSLQMARYRNSVHTMLVVYVVFLASYLPHNCLSGVVLSGRIANSLTTKMFLLTTTVVFMNSCVNPFLYCWRISEIRQLVLRSLRTLCCKLCCR